MAGAWTVDQVAQEVRKNLKKRNPVTTALLTGAGCSYQGGIPLAGGFVDEISKRFPDEFARAAEKTYPFCMAELSARDRHDLISEFIDQAKINWAHISIAQLMRAGFVDRVLTTNFDPLIRRACGLLNCYPAIYDMAVVRKGFVADFVRDLAVFHLHGQRDGFVQLHRKEEVDALREAIEPLFDDTARNRLWVVIGYSGANDPVFRALADRPEFPNRLFWVGFRDEEPSAAVKQELIDAGKDVHWIKGYDPDTFLMQLASRLGAFPPGFFAKPFSHLKECFGTLAGFRLPGQDQELDWAARARDWIGKAIDTYEVLPTAPPPAAPPPAAPPAAPPSPPPFMPAPAAAAGGIELGSGRRPASAPMAPDLDLELERGSPPASPAPSPAPAAAPVPEAAEGDVVTQAWTALMAGEHDKVIALASQCAGIPQLALASQCARIPELAEPVAWSLASSAKKMLEQAEGASGAAADDLRRQAEDYAALAEALRPGLGAFAVGRR